MDSPSDKLQTCIITRKLSYENMDSMKTSDRKRYCRFKAEQEDVSRKWTDGKKQPRKYKIDEWGINSSQSKYRRMLGEIAAKEMLSIFHEVVREKCYGCIIDHPSQRQHYYLMASEVNI